MGNKRALANIAGVGQLALSLGATEGAETAPSDPSIVLQTKEKSIITCATSEAHVYYSKHSDSEIETTL